MIKTTVFGKEFRSIQAACREYNINYNTYYKNLITYGTSVENYLITRGISGNVDINLEDCDELTVEDDDNLFEELNSPSICKEIYSEDNSEIIDIYNNDIAIKNNKQLNTVLSPLDLVALLNKPNNKKIMLIDFENITSVNILSNLVEDENNINIFFFNACLYSNQYYSLTNKKKSLNIQVVTMEVYRQLVDHMITYYLGVLDALYPNNEYYIVSGDRGFNRIPDNLHRPNIHIINTEDLTRIKGNSFLYAIIKYLSLQKSICHNMYLPSLDLKMIFSNFIKNNQGKDKEKIFNNILDILVKHKILHFIRNHRDSIYDDIYKINIKTLSKILRKMEEN